MTPAAPTAPRTSGPVARLQQALAEWADLLASMDRHVEAYELTREALRATAPLIDQRGPRAVLSIHRGTDPIQQEVEAAVGATS